MYKIAIPYLYTCTWDNPLALEEYLHVQADKPWCNYYLIFAHTSDEFNGNTFVIVIACNDLPEGSLADVAGKLKFSNIHLPVIACQQYLVGVVHFTCNNKR